MNTKHLIAVGSALFIGFFALLLAHPGITDKDGCHVCKDHCKGWGLYDGEFHCHQPNIYGERYFQETLTKERLICHAIQNKKILKFKKIGEQETTILVEPYQYGLDKEQKLHLKAWVKGEKEGEGKWEDFDIIVINVKEMKVMQETFDGNRAGAPTEGGSAFVKVLCTVQK